MLSFASGHFVRTWKHGGHDWDSAWTAAEKTKINTCVAAIALALPGLMQTVGSQIAQAHTALPYLNQDKLFIYRWHLWLSRIAGTMKMFSDMQTDIGAGGKKITMRKAGDLNISDEVSALCEFNGKKPRWVISVNRNPKDKACYFFNPANTTKATASLFHELTHLYGTEDTGVMAIENAHQLERLMGPTSARDLRTLLRKQRTFTMLGDATRFPRGAVVSLSRLTAVYGQGNCWDKTGFATNFTGDPVKDDMVTRKSDGKQGTISIIWDSNDQPLYFYNFF